VAALDEHDRRIIEAYKASITPSSDVAQSNWDVIADIVGHEDEVRRPRRWLPWVAAAPAVLLVSYVELRAVTVPLDPDGARPVQSFDQAEASPSSPVEPSAPPAVRTDARPSPAAADAPALPSPAPEPGFERVVEEPPVVHPEPSKRRSVRPPPKAHDVRDEVRLLEHARAALAREDFARVLALAARHEREHPAGMLREEVAMLRVVALCTAGPESRWRSARSRFERDFSGSPLLAHLRDDCFP
jgi:hypothetical protein